MSETTSVGKAGDKRKTLSLRISATSTERDTTSSTSTCRDVCEIEGFQVHSAAERIDAPPHKLPSLHVKVLWSAELVPHLGRAHWYHGIVSKFNPDTDEICVEYRDGDTFWEARSACVFLK